MKPFSGCLIAIIVPVGLIWVALFLRDVWIDHTLELQTTLPESFVSEAEYNPDRFEERLLSAFNVLAGEDDYVTPDKQVTYHNRWHAKQWYYDLNKDGLTSMIEMEKIRRRSWYYNKYYNSTRQLGYNATYLMAFDTNHDQKVTRHEFELELNTIKFQRCPFPQISKDAKLVFIISESGGQPSIVSVSGFADVTEVSNLHIPKDAPKMYIVAMSKEPVIWNISGNIDRIENFVVQGSENTNRAIRSLNLANVGVVGIPEEKLSFLGKKCLQHKSPYSYKPIPIGLERQNKMSDRLMSRVGQSPDIVISEHQVNEVSLPNGYLSDTKTGDHKERMATRKEIGSKWKKSYFETNLQNVISPTPPVRYEIYPGKTGINQLVRDRKITRLRSEGGSYVYQVNEELPHFPIGLVLHRYIFVFDAKTPQPDFNPGYDVRVRYF